MKTLKKMLFLVLFIFFFSACTEDEIFQEDSKDLNSEIVIKTGGDGAEEPDNERDGD